MTQTNNDYLYWRRMIIYVFCNIFSYIYLYIGIQRCRHTTKQAYNEIGMQRYRHAAMQACSDVGMQRCRHTTIQAYSDVGIQRCRHTIPYAYSDIGIQCHMPTAHILPFKWSGLQLNEPLLGAYQALFRHLFYLSFGEKLYNKREFLALLSRKYKIKYNSSPVGAVVGTLDQLSLS